MSTKANFPTRGQAQSSTELSDTTETESKK